MKEFPVLFLCTNTRALFLKLSYTEGKGRQGRKKEGGVNQSRVLSIVTLHCFDLTGKNQEVILSITDLILFPTVMDSIDIGVKLQSCDI